MALGFASPRSSSSLCVLFADVSESMRWFEELGDVEASKVISDCLRHMSAVTESFQGRVIQTMGDGLLATFPSAEFGVQAASQMMHRIDHEPRIAGKRVAIRIGFHFGPLLVGTSNLFGGQVDIAGDTVNTTARIAALAKARQILTTETTLHLLPQRWQAAARYVDAFSLKGKSTIIKICEILWQQPEDLTITATLQPPVENQRHRLSLVHFGRLWVLDQQANLTIGRESHNDICIDDRRISRQHARIERRRNRFLLIDNSTNGTFITPEGKPEQMLRMEEFSLFGRGIISLGHKRQGNDPLGLLSFEVS